MVCHHEAHAGPSASTGGGGGMVRASGMTASPLRPSGIFSMASVRAVRNSKIMLATVARALVRPVGRAQGGCHSGRVGGYPLPPDPPPR